MNKNTTTNQPQQTQTAPKRPNDTGSISVTGFVKIFDPNTKEKFVEQRA
jgi:hypothetical protein